MKKNYIVPVIEVVNVHLLGSVLEGETTGLGPDSTVATTMDAKQTDFEDFNSEEDIWGGNSIQMKDVWER